MTCSAEMYDGATRKLGIVVPSKSGQALSWTAPLSKRTTLSSTTETLGTALALACANRPQTTASKPRQQVAKSTIETQACRIMFEWCEGDPAENQIRSFEVVLPPVPMPSASAVSLWSCMQNHRAYVAVRRCKDAMRRCCIRPGSLAADFDHSDDASGNDLYYAGLLKRDYENYGGRLMKTRSLCLNHGAQQAVIDSISASSGLAFISGGWTPAVFLSMGTYWLRCIVSLPRLLRKPGCVVSTTARVEAVDVAFATELIDYIIANHRGSDKMKNQLQSALSISFKELWTSGYHRRGTVHHDCLGPGLCICDGDPK